MDSFTYSHLLKTPFQLSHKLCIFMFPLAAVDTVSYMYELDF